MLKMEKEFNLSEKIQDLETYEKDNLLFLKAYGRKENINLLTMGDVKEFIRLLKEEFDYAYWAKFDYQNCRILEGEFNKEINKLAGSKLQ